MLQERLIEAYKEQRVKDIGYTENIIYFFKVQKSISIIYRNKIKSCKIKCKKY